MTDRPADEIGEARQLAKDTFFALGLRKFPVTEADAVHDIDVIENALSSFATSNVARAEKAESERDAAIARVKQLEHAISWALGEVDDFAERKPGQGAYWWRSELRRRALGGASGETGT